MVNQKYLNLELLFVLLFHIVAPHGTVFTKYIGNILKAYIKNENNNSKNFTKNSDASEMFPMKMTR